MRFRWPLNVWRVPTWPGQAGEERAPIILLYHGVVRAGTDPFGIRVSPRNFAEQMAVLRAHANPVPLAHMGNGPLPPRSVAITVDDGYADNFAHLKPIVERARIPATIFIATGQIGSDHEFFWDELDAIFLQPSTIPAQLSLKVGERTLDFDFSRWSRLSMIDAFRHRHWRAWHKWDPTPRHTAFRAVWEALHTARVSERDQAMERVRAWAGRRTPSSRSRRLSMKPHELQQIARSEFIQIGAHTVNHPSLAALDPVEQRHEIFESKKWLERTLERPVTTFSYPYGGRANYTAETVQLVRAAGFERACSNFPGPVEPGGDRLQLPRYNVLDWSGAEFAGFIARWMAEASKAAGQSCQSR